jgi:hypothetical protein
LATDNVTANPGAGGDSFRTLADTNNVEWPASVLGYPTTIAPGANVVQLVDATHGLPVAVVGTPAVTAVVTNAGTFATQAAQSGAWNIGTVAAVTGITNPVAVTDDAGSLTVDAPVGTPVYVRLSDGASAIATLPVSVAAAVAVTDNGGSLTVDGTVGISGTVTVAGSGTFNTSAAQSGAWAVRNQDGAGNALTSATRGSERALSVQVVDAGGAQITTFGGGSGGTQYAEGATAATITGTALMWEDAGDTLRSVSAAKPLPVAIISGAGSGGTASNFGSADPAAGTAAGFSDGTNMREARVFDADTGAGTQYVLGAVLRKSAGGGSVEAGTATDPLRTDPTGSTAQPVTDNAGSLTVDAPVGTPVFVRLSDGASAIATLPVSAAGLPLPTGAATAAKQPAPGTAGTASADVITVQGIASMTALKVDGSAVTQPVSGTVGITANSSVNVAQIAGTTTATGNGTASAGCQRVTIASDNTAVPVADAPVTSGGLSVSRAVSAASNNATSAKASAGQVYAVTAFNTNAAPRYLKIYNKATAPAPATDAALLVAVFMIPGNTAGAGVVHNIDKGIACGSGIGWALVTGMSDTDNTSTAAGECVAGVYYK